MSKRAKVLFALFSALLLAISITGTVVMFSGEASADTGIAACQSMKKNAEDGKSSSSDSKMTDAQRKEKRAPFESSQYADIRVAGTNLVESIYEMDQKKDDVDLGGALAMVTTIRTQYAALQTACSAHGVDLPNLPSS